MPAEWEPHESTWLAWPHERPDWPCKFGPIPWVYGEIVRRLERVERVRILVQNAQAEQIAGWFLQKAHAALEAVAFFQVKTDRS
ncbi:MAG: agmatine deiminase family protein, partial [Bryobacteraceae bacterium]